MTEGYEMDNEQNQGGEDNAVIRGLREKARKAEELERENATLKAEQAATQRRVELNNLIDKVGVNGEDRERLAKLADKFIEGDLSEDKVRDLASEYKLIAPATEGQNEAQAMQQVAGAHVGSQTAGSISAEGQRDLEAIKTRQMRGEHVPMSEVAQAFAKAGIKIDSSAAPVMGGFEPLS